MSGQLTLCRSSDEHSAAAILRADARRFDAYIAGKYPVRTLRRVLEGLVSRARSAIGSIGSAVCVDCGRRKSWAGASTARGFAMVEEERARIGWPRVEPSMLRPGPCKCDGCPECKRPGCICDVRGEGVPVLRKALRVALAELDKVEVDLLPLPVEDAWNEEREALGDRPRRRRDRRDA